MSDALSSQYNTLNKDTMNAETLRQELENGDPQTIIEEVNEEERDRLSSSRVPPAVDILEDHPNFQISDFAPSYRIAEKGLGFGQWH